MPTYRARKPRLPRSLAKFAPRNQLGLPTGPSLSSPTISSGSPSAFYRGTTTPAPTPPIPVLAGLAGGAAGGAGAAPGRKPAGTFPSARPPASVDPYAPQTPEQISAQVAAAVKAQTDPVLKQIADQIAARTTAAQQAIIGYTNAFGPALQQLAGIGPAGYQTGIQSQAAIDSALQQSLTGGGTAAASELGAKLAQINAPEADQQVAAQAAIGAGAGNAALATGSASLSALVAQLAGAQNVAAKQPGIAALYGGQATRDLQAQASRDLVDQQGQVTSQIPGLISTLTQNATSDARSQANANRTFNEGVREFGVNRGDRVAAARTQAQMTLANARAKAAQQALARQDAQDKRLSQDTGYVYVNGRPAMVKGQPISTLEAQKLAQQGTIASQKLQATQDAATQRAKEARVRAIVSEGYDPQTGELTPKARASLAGELGYDPITGKPTARTKIAAVNAQTSAARAQTQAAEGRARLGLASSSQQITLKRLIAQENRDAAKATTAAQQQAWSRAQKDAAAKSRGGIIYHVVPDAKGNPTVQQWVVNGKAQRIRTGSGAGKAPSISDRNQIAKWDATAEGFASTMYNGGADPNGKTIDPQTYTEAVAQAKLLNVPFEVAKKHLDVLYKHGNKAVHDFVTDPDVRFTMTGAGRVAALKNGKLVRYMKPGNPGYSIALERAKKGE